MILQIKSYNAHIRYEFRLSTDNQGISVEEADGFRRRRPLALSISVDKDLTFTIGVEKKSVQNSFPGVVSILTTDTCPS